jgi:hypothetical protein
MEETFFVVVCIPCHTCGQPSWLCHCWDDDNEDFVGYPTYGEIYPEDEHA